MKKISLLAVVFSLAAMPFAYADETPVGLWKNIDDKTGKPKALIRITESNGELQGKIEKLFLDDGADKNPKCDKCEGPNKDQPVIGMTILYGLKKDSDEYNGGKIIDPANGKVYSSKLHLTDNNKKLNVRGYIGTPFLGRSQVWIREQ
ncbi:DUF2147 domain-containing protein [Undibacterium curvum]|uniref:DUF2147 domain-containing protein n=1 Tax=Undibacterium curvum TaxID=2762294 RepID=UPI003D0EA5C0